MKRFLKRVILVVAICVLLFSMAGERVTFAQEAVHAGDTTVKAFVSYEGADSDDDNGDDAGDDEDEDDASGGDDNKNDENFDEGSSSKTGDDSNVGLWFSIAVCALAAIWVIVLKRNSSDRSEQKIDRNK